MKTFLCAILVVLTVAACGGKNGGDDGGDDTTGGGDGGGSGTGDGPITPPGCKPDTVLLSQCTDCIDNDNDGYVDSYDLECTGPRDNDESSFATGIPGDNMDAV